MGWNCAGTAGYYRMGNACRVGRRAGPGDPTPLQGPGPAPPSAVPDSEPGNVHYQEHGDMVATCGALSELSSPKTEGRRQDGSPAHNSLD
ncbi:hypothetical protein P7K49_034001, partial [Saguinus oedipus]